MKNYCKLGQHAVSYAALSDTSIGYKSSWVIRTPILSLVNNFYIFIVTTFKFALL
jgi:hypothetical protein